MPRSSNYYAQQNNPAASSPTSPAGVGITPHPVTPLQVSPTPAQVQAPVQQQPDTFTPVHQDPAKLATETAAAQIESDKPWWTRITPPDAYTVQNTVLGGRLPPQEQWNKMNWFDQGMASNKAIGGFVWDMIKSAPANIIKAPIALNLGLQEAVSRTESALGVAKQNVPKAVSFSLPGLGKVEGFGDVYDAAIQAGKEPYEGIVDAVNKTLGDITTGLAAVEAGGNFLTKPRFVESPNSVISPDYRGLSSEQVAQMKTTVEPGTEVIKTNTIKQNPNVTYVPVSQDVAAQYGGKAGSTFAKISPIGDGQVEVSIVRAKGNLIGMAKSKLQNLFGSSSTVGEYGPEVKLHSEIIDVGPSPKQIAAPAEPAPWDKPVAPVPETAEAAKQSIQSNLTPEQFKVEQGILSARETDLSFPNPQMESDYQMFKIMATRQKWMLDSGTDEATLKSRLAKKDAVLASKIDQQLFNATDEGLTNDEMLAKFKERYDQDQQVKDIASKKTPTEVALAEQKAAKKSLPATTPSQLPATVPDNITTEVPSLMPKPIKGMEDKAVTGKQIDQIRAIQQDRGFDDATLQAINRVTTGKTNLNDLTQKEAFHVSETVRSFADTKPTEGYDETGSIFDKSIRQQSRVVFEDIERQTKLPVYTDLHVPVETGIRLARVRDNAMVQQFNDVFGKYADPQYHEEQRALTHYLEGDKSVIDNNPNYSPEKKAELTAIAEWAKKYFQDAKIAGNIESTRFDGNYVPHLQKLGGVFTRYKGADLPADIRPFYEFERKGTMDPLEDNLLVLLQTHSRMMSKDMFLSQPLINAKSVIDKAPTNIKAFATSWLQEVFGFEDGLSKKLNKLGENLSNATNGFIPANISKQIVDLAVTNSSAAATGLPRIEAAVRNIFQMSLAYAEFGPKAFLDGLNKLTSPGGMEEVRDKGFLLDRNAPYGAELAQQLGQGPIGKAVDAYKKLEGKSMFMDALTSKLTRGLTYHSVVSRFDENWKLFLDNKIDFNTFKTNINMDGFSPTLQEIIRQKLLKNTKESIGEAKDLMVGNAIDRVAFPMRKGAEGRAFYGLTGKLGMQFGGFTSEYWNTITREWAGRRQWMKLIRWMAASTVITRSMQDAFGIDSKKWTGLASLAVPMSPLVTAAISMFKTVNASQSGIDDQVNSNWKDVANSLRLYEGSFAGVGAQHITTFLKSVKRYEGGMSPTPDPKKPFWVISSTGKALYPVDFAGLLKTAMGFKTKESVDFENRTNTITNATAKQNGKMSKAMDYLADGDFKKFDQMVISNNLQIGDIATRMQSYTRPLDQRLYDKMPLELKVKYYKLFNQN